MCTTFTNTSEVSVWSTWKPYAVIALALLGGGWWCANESSIATLKDGAYQCQVVFVGQDGKYQVPIDDDGYPFRGTATLRGGDLVAMEGDSAMPASQLASLTMRTSGTSHVHVTDEPGMHSYYAVACDHSG